MGALILVGTIPIGICGYVFRDQIETGARNLNLIGTTLIVLGLAAGARGKVSPRSRGLDSLSTRDGLVIGCAQALALIPGVSRSGATITAGLFLGFDRTAAARYSFLLSVPAVVLSGLFELKDIGGGGRAGAGATAVATLLAFVVGYASIAFLLRYLTTHSTMVFVVYRVVLGTVVLIARGPTARSPDGHTGPMARSTELVRPRRRIIAGVCAGLARRFGASPTLVRVLFVASCPAAGAADPDLPGAVGDHAVGVTRAARRTVVRFGARPRSGRRPSAWRRRPRPAARRCRARSGRRSRPTARPDLRAGAAGAAGRGLGLPPRLSPAAALAAGGLIVVDPVGRPARRPPAGARGRWRRLGDRRGGRGGRGSGAVVRLVAIVPERLGDGAGGGVQRPADGGERQVTGSRRSLRMAPHALPGRRARASTGRATGLRAERATSRGAAIRRPHRSPHAGPCGRQAVTARMPCSALVSHASRPVSASGAGREHRRTSTPSTPASPISSARVTPGRIAALVVDDAQHVLLPPQQARLAALQQAPVASEIIASSAPWSRRPRRAARRGGRCRAPCGAAEAGVGRSAIHARTVSDGGARGAQEQPQLARAAPPQPQLHAREPAPAARQLGGDRRAERRPGSGPPTSRTPAAKRAQWWSARARAPRRPARSRPPRRAGSARAGARRRGPSAARDRWPRHGGSRGSRTGAHGRGSGSAKGGGCNGPANPTGRPRWGSPVLYSRWMSLSARERPRQRVDPAIFRLPVERIRDGYYSDAYFTFTKELLEAEDRHPRVLMQVFQRETSVLGGIDEAIAVLRLCSGRRSADGRGRHGWDELEVRALHEGDPIAPLGDGDDDRGRLRRCSPTSRPSTSAAWPAAR